MTYSLDFAWHRLRRCSRLNPMHPQRPLRTLPPTQLPLLHWPLLIDFLSQHIYLDCGAFFDQ